jgi:outer membrane protein assembly factor BamB
MILAVVVALACGPAQAQDAKSPRAPFPYVPARAYHILPETHNNESGYFSLVEGMDGKIYVGTAKYGENSYLVEFDPATDTQRIVIDTNKVTGASGRGYAAQSKIHTKNFVGPSGKVYVGSKEGYPTAEETAAHDIAPYPGGYVMTYDPKTGRAESLGMPYPGQGVGDVVADESRGLLYVVTCEDEYWIVHDTKTRRYRWLGPQLFDYASTLVDARGRANAITSDYRLARWDPATNTLSIQDIVVDGKKLEPPDPKDRTGWIPSWSLAKDGTTAYLIRMSYPELFRLDLGREIDKPVPATNLGRMIEGKGSDCRSGLAVGPDGRVYAAIAVLNNGTFGTGHQLNHLTRFDPKTNRFEDLGVLKVENPDFFDFDATGPDGKKKPFTYGYQKLPDGALTPQYQHLGAIVARDGTAYVLILYPYTLLRVKPEVTKAAQ